MVDGRQIARTKAEERRQKLASIRNRRRNRSSVIAGIAVILLVVAIWLYNSGLFNIKAVDIAGNKYVSAVKIAEASQVTEQSNLLSVSTGEIKQRVLKNPWICDAQVMRALPSTLRINVVERVPVALVNHAGKFYVIDDDLFVIAERPYADDAKVPVITDAPLDKVKVGGRLVNEPLQNAVKCLTLMDPALQKTINLLSASSVDKLSLYNKDNIEVLYGNADQASIKNKVLQNILEQQGKQVIFIDIRSYPQSDPVLKRMDSVP